MGFYSTELMSAPAAKSKLGCRPHTGAKTPIGALFRHTILSAKYWDADAKLSYYGYRYYSPGMGRWLNRDPIEESGGENCYIFVRNYPITFVDPLGLKWYVYRNFGSRANAGVDCDGGTINKLAKMVKLDPQEYLLWLEDADHKGMPNSVDEQIKGPRSFSVPNEVHVTQGDASHWSGDYILKRIAYVKNNDVREWKEQKYAVKEHWANNTSGILLTDASTALQSPDIAVWLHYGHGSKGNLGFELIWYTPYAFVPHHKLSYIKLYACEAGRKRALWKEKVAPGGDLYAPYFKILP